jgi:hypothetical protein
MYGLYVDDKKVMGLSYKPELDDVIKDDDTGKWYKVLRIKGRKAYARPTIDPRMY